MDSSDDKLKNARILIIDDERGSAYGLARILQIGGYAICITITDPQEALQRFRQIAPDLVLLDLHMEPVSGIDVLREVAAMIPPREQPPFLVLTADTTDEAKREALAAGATDFLAKPLDHTEVLLRIRNLLRTRALYERCQLYNQGLERIVGERTAELQKQARELERALAELQDAQRQIIQQERLRALGTMASGIAHDLNNSLCLILGYGDLLLRPHPDRPNAPTERRYLESMVLAAQDSAHMVKRLREFYRPRAGHENRQLVDIDKLVDATIELTTPRWKALAEADGADIAIRHEPGLLPQIAGDPAELREVLTNLIFNAVDAMPDGGTITIRTLRDYEWVRLEISDTGIGMSAETREHCLEPFYTTKGERGSGLGLAVAYGIIRRHGGVIDIQTRCGEGTTFVIRLPILDAPAAPACEREACRTPPLRILLVDDHPAIREIVGAYLAEDRHSVETAATGNEALEKFRAQPFDLVITDRAMPEMNGDDLACTIKQLQPREPVIMLTGFADLMKESGNPADNVDLVLSKPARLADLRRAITHVMKDS